MNLKQTENISKLFSLMNAIELSLENMRNAKEDGKANMGLIWGASGWGKSSAIKLYKEVKGENVVLIRARRTWTASWLIEDTARALGLSTSGRTRDKFDRICEYLTKDPKVLIFDEMNHFVDDVRIMETLRDIHDISNNNPVIIVGSEGIEKRIKRYTSLCDRLRINIDFSSVKGKDVELFAKDLKSDFTKEVCQEIANKSNGKSLRAMMRILELCDEKARANNIKSIDLALYKQLRGVE